MLLAPRVEPRVVLTFLLCTGQPCTEELLLLKTSTVLRLGNLRLKPCAFGLEVGGRRLEWNKIRRATAEALSEKGTGLLC